MHREMNSRKSPTYITSPSKYHWGYDVASVEDDDDDGDGDGDDDDVDSDSGDAGSSKSHDDLKCRVVENSDNHTATVCIDHLGYARNQSYFKLLRDASNQAIAAGNSFDNPDDASIILLYFMNNLWLRFQNTTSLKQEMIRSALELNDLNRILEINPYDYDICSLFRCVVGSEHGDVTVKDYMDLVIHVIITATDTEEMKASKKVKAAAAAKSEAAKADKAAKAAAEKKAASLVQEFPCPTCPNLRPGRTVHKGLGANNDSSCNACRKLS